LGIVLDLKLVHYARTLAVHRNFARAAEALDISQPALSRSISRLEAGLGVQLFNRTAQGVEPTGFGERYLARGGELLDGAAELERELQLMQGVEAGVLRVAAGPYPADMCVAPALGRLIGRHPRVRVELGTGDWRTIVGALLRGQLDLAVVELSAMALDARLITEALPTHRAAFFCRVDHPLLRDGPATLERIFEYPFVSPKLPPRVGAIFHRLAKAWAIDPDTGDYLPPVKADTLALAMSVVSSSDAIAVAPLCIVADQVRAGRFGLLPLRPPWLHTNYGFVHLKDRALSPAAQAFITEVRAVEAELVEAEKRVSDD
jgi:DNA-binding transcriptional LysR family regulator